jgi:sugar phosphate isomerase/epimerase
VKLACSNLAWSPTDDAAVALTLRAAGVTGVELAPSKVWPKAPRVVDGAAEAYQSWWKDAGCEVVAFQAILYGHPEFDLFGDDAAVAALQRHLADMGALAARCGARVLVLGAPGNRKRGHRSMTAAVAAAARVLRAAAETLPTDVALCIEPNPPRYGCDFVTTAAEAAVLCDAVSHPRFGVHLDTAALALSGETTVGALAPVMPHVRHLHLSEVDLVPVGTSSSMPHAALGDAFRGAGYDGWISVEMKLGEGDDWRTALPRAAAVARDFYLG